MKFFYTVQEIRKYGESFITSWDTFHEKYGFELIKVKRSNDHLYYKKTINYQKNSLYDLEKITQRYFFNILNNYFSDNNSGIIILKCESLSKDVLNEIAKKERIIKIESLK